MGPITAGNVGQGATFAALLDFLGEELTRMMGEIEHLGLRLCLDGPLNDRQIMVMQGLDEMAQRLGCISAMLRSGGLEEALPHARLDALRARVDAALASAARG